MTKNLKGGECSNKSEFRPEEWLDQSNPLHVHALPPIVELIRKEAGANKFVAGEVTQQSLSFRSHGSCPIVGGHWFSA